MEIVFLGTSSGTPTKQRNLSAVAIKRCNTKRWYLVDCGEATQHRILHTRLSLNSLQAIFITHVHGDHCFGLPGLLASAAMAGRTAPLTIVAPGALKAFMDAALAVTQVGLPYVISFRDVEGLGAERLETADFNVEVAGLSHRVPSFAYSFSETGIHRRLDVARLEAEGIESGPVWGRIHKGEKVVLADGREIQGTDYLLESRKPRKVIVAGDNDSPALLSESVKSANVLVHEATYTEDIARAVGAAHQHSSAHAVAQFAACAGLDNLILTHFSPRYQEAADSNPSISDIRLEAAAVYQGHLFLANDLDTFRLDRAGRLSRLPG